MKLPPLAAALASLLASAALVVAAFTATPVVAQGDPNVCDGVIEGPLTLDMTMHTGSNPGAEMATVEAFNAGPGAELGVTVNVIPIGETAYETAITSAAQLRELLASNKELAQRFDELEARIEKKLVGHDQAIAAMLSAIRGLMNPPDSKSRGIGFTANLGKKT